MKKRFTEEQIVRLLREAETSANDAATDGVGAQFLPAAIGDSVMQDLPVDSKAVDKRTKHSTRYDRVPCVRYGITRTGGAAAVIARSL